MSDPSSPPDRDALRVAFQGELGAFSEEAVHRFFGSGVEPLPCREFADVGRCVLDADADFGILPIENTLAGSVVASYDVLAAGDLELVGEVITPIHHCVLGVPGATLDRVTRILSHPVALMQCTRLLRSLRDVQAVAVYDTAGAARDVASAADPTQAAIAAHRAAARYGLAILAEGVEDRPDNQTRFLVVAPRLRPSAHPALPRHPEAPMKSAAMVETRNLPGALLQVLSPFSERGINLSKLESRPTGEPWSYRFFIEMDADGAASPAAEALEEVRERAVRLVVLGTYPRWVEREGHE
jgi:prephenate dehydratase